MDAYYRVRWRGRRGETLGDHIKKRRLELRLLQREVGERIGVSPFTVAHWEKGSTEPTIRDWPQVITFLGYDPVPNENTIADRLLAIRRRRGLSQRELAAELGVDPGTLSGWELGIRVPRGRFADLVDAILSPAGSS